MKTALVCGAGGFIGSHLVRRLKAEGFWVRGVDLKLPSFSPSATDDFVQGDLRDPILCRSIVESPGTGRVFDEVYQLAADMGGAGYIFTGENDADIMHNSATINLNMLDALQRAGAKGGGVGRVFYSSSACIYPEHNQLDPDNPNCEESSAYPAAPDSEYGWEKLFSERLFLAYGRNHGMSVHIARYHNIFGPEGTWRGGKEKAPAPSAARSPKPKMAARSRSGAMAAKPAPSSSSTNAWKAPPASCAATPLARSISAPMR